MSNATDFTIITLMVKRQKVIHDIITIIYYHICTTSGIVQYSYTVYYISYIVHQIVIKKTQENKKM